MTEEQAEKPKHEKSAVTQEQAQSIARYCEDVIRCLKLDLNVEYAIDAGMIRINLSGPDRPLLLSSTASVLNSMEYLVNKVFRSGRSDENPSIVLDSDSYRQHREAELVLLAQMASKKVLEQQKPMSLQPMTPKERRIVHLALAQIEGVRSQSQGDGDSRSITIYPS